jgi:hypothetical protein
MNDATPLWERWQALLGPFAPVFTRPGWGRVVPWGTGMVLGWEEPTITPILTALGLEARWRVQEHCAAYGAWDRDAVERQTLRLIEQERPARWARDPPVALDATTRHRTRAKVWGPRTVHTSSAHSPNRAETVRAHHWVVMGDWGSGTPWRYLPHAARLYCRKNPLPAGEHLRTKTTVAGEWLRQADVESAAPRGIFAPLGRPGRQEPNPSGPCLARKLCQQGCLKSWKLLPNNLCKAHRVVDICEQQHHYRFFS